MGYVSSLEGICSIPNFNSWNLRSRVPGDGEIRRWPWYCHVLRCSNVAATTTATTATRTTKATTNKLHHLIFAFFWGSFPLWSFLSPTCSATSNRHPDFSHWMDIYKATARIALAQYLHVIWAGWWCWCSDLTPGYMELQVFFSVEIWTGSYVLTKYAQVPLKCTVSDFSGGEDSLIHKPYILKTYIRRSEDLHKLHELHKFT